MANKTTIIDSLSEICELGKSKIGMIIDGFINCIVNTVSSGESVTITGFGTFEPRFRKARVGHLPKDPSTKIDIPSKTVPVFRAGKAFKDSVNNK